MKKGIILLIVTFYLTTQPWGQSNALLRFNSAHFVIYHSDHIAHRWVEKVSTLLEDGYDSMGKIFGHYPKRIIPVRIYDRTWEFTKATKMPYHTGAVYDGSLNIQHPRTIERLGDLKSILSHEYTHLLLDEICGGKVKLWLSEGLAVYMAGQNPVTTYRTKIKSFKDLEGLLTKGKSRNEKLFAYKVSLSVAKRLFAMKPWEDILLFLRKLARGRPFHILFYEAFKMKLADFEEEALKNFRH
ncbi:MAG: hypothetical protein OEZ36_04795 [Spirochaetota bacterium]|nr:hypothetical protein [Spirochaetota bacterium]